LKEREKNDSGEPHHLSIEAKEQKKAEVMNIENLDGKLQTSHHPELVRNADLHILLRSNESESAF
jgi:hypothetical protein